MRIALFSGGKESLYASIIGGPIDAYVMFIYEFPEPSPHGMTAELTAGCSPSTPPAAGRFSILPASRSPATPASTWVFSTAIMITRSPTVSASMMRPAISLTSGNSSWPHWIPGNWRSTISSRASIWPRQPTA